MAELVYPYLGRETTMDFLLQCITVESTMYSPGLPFDFLLCIQISILTQILFTDQHRKLMLMICFMHNILQKVFSKTILGELS